MTGIEVRRAADRARTRQDGLDSRHSFSYGHHYDPGNTSHGVLLASNDDVLAGGAGFDAHPHRDLEVVTWVVEGALAHEDSTGRRGVVRPGQVQRMSAGRGVVHSERNADAVAPVRYVQMWVAPDGHDRPPGHQQGEVDEDALRSGLVPVASGLARDATGTAVGLGNAGAALLAARLSSGQAVVLPDAPWVHLFVALGTVVLEGAGTLLEGDAARLTGARGRRLQAVGAAEVLVWEMHVTLG